MMQVISHLLFVVMLAWSMVDKLILQLIVNWKKEDDNKNRIFISNLIVVICIYILRPQSHMTFPLYYVYYLAFVRHMTLKSQF